MSSTEPRKMRKTYPCTKCSGGHISKNEDGYWQCDTCDFFSNECPYYEQEEA
jgi:ribosomal protein L37AE/L43A